MGELFSFSGRIRRMTLWVNALINGVIYGILYGISVEVDSTAVAVVLIVVYLVLAVRSLSLSVRRWHDLNKSGMWVFINLIPLVGSIYSLVMQGFMPGDQGPNQFGPEPEPGQFI